MLIEKERFGCSRPCMCSCIRINAKLKNMVIYKHLLPSILNQTH